MDTYTHDGVEYAVKVSTDAGFETDTTLVKLVRHTGDEKFGVILRVHNDDLPDGVEMDQVIRAFFGKNGAEEIGKVGTGCAYNEIRVYVQDGYLMANMGFTPVRLAPVMGGFNVGTNEGDN